MTGTERAALRLALGVLRGTDEGAYGTRTAKMLLWVGGSDLWDALEPFFNNDGHVVGVSSRILRARLALTIRALLRAERGEAGEFAVVERRTHNEEAWCGWYVWRREARMADGETWAARGFGRFVEYRVRLARPLWTLARAHGGRT